MLLLTFSVEYWRDIEVWVTGQKFMVIENGADR